MNDRKFKWERNLLTHGTCHAAIQHPLGTARGAAIIIPTRGGAAAECSSVVAALVLSEGGELSLVDGQLLRHAFVLLD